MPRRSTQHTHARNACCENTREQLQRGHAGRCWRRRSKSDLQNPGHSVPAAFRRRQRWSKERNGHGAVRCRRQVQACRASHGECKHAGRRANRSPQAGAHQRRATDSCQIRLCDGQRLNRCSSLELLGAQCRERLRRGNAPGVLLPIESHCVEAVPARVHQKQPRRQDACATQRSWQQLRHRREQRAPTGPTRHHARFAQLRCASQRRCVTYRRLLRWP